MNRDDSKQTPMYEKKIKDLEAKIADLKKRWPAHSVPPVMMIQLDELEEELEMARKSLAVSKKRGRNSGLREID